MSQNAGPTTGSVGLPALADFDFEGWAAPTYWVFAEGPPPASHAPATQESQSGHLLGQGPGSCPSRDAAGAPSSQGTVTAQSLLAPLPCPSLHGHYWGCGIRGDPDIEGGTPRPPVCNQASWRSGPGLAGAWEPCPPSRQGQEPKGLFRGAVRCATPTLCVGRAPVPCGRRVCRRRGKRLLPPSPGPPSREAALAGWGTALIIPEQMSSESSIP